MDSISDLAFFVRLVKHGSLSALAREARVHPSQLYAWRRALCAGRGRAQVDFATVRNASDPAAARVARRAECLVLAAELRVIA